MQNQIYAPKPQLSNIPNELKLKPLWRPWVYSPPPEGKIKPLKTPLSAITLSRSNNTSDFSDCVTFDDLEAMLLSEQVKSYENQRFHGVGYSLDGSTHAIDLDYAIDQDGNITSFALDILENIPGYVERSVSGRGFHIFTKLADCETTIIEKSLNLEIYKDKRFIAVTGDIDRRFNKGIPLNPVSFEPLKKYLVINNQKSNLSEVKYRDPNWSLERIKIELLSELPKELSYDEWIQIGMALHFQSEGSDEGFYLFDEFSANAENYPSGNEPSTRDKWNSFKNKNSSVTVGTLIHLKNKYFDLKKYASSVTNKPLLRKLKDARHELKKIDWLVDGMIKSGSLVMFAGAPSGGKTYLAIELLMSVASGKPFLDQYFTKQGDAVFIACEGRDSVLRRASAWINAKNNFEEIDNVYISEGEIVVSLPEKAEVSSESMSNFMVENDINPKLIVIDTMNFSLGSAKENDVNDMTDYFRKISNNMIRKFGATVLLIHHTSKDNSDIRGSSSIRGALDSLFLVSQPQGNLFKVVNDKHKDRDLLFPFNLEGKSIDINLPDGSIESNLVLYRSQIQVSASGLSPIHQKALEVLEGEVGINGVMNKSDLLAHLGDSRLPKNASRDIFKPLTNKGYIETNGRKVTLIKPKDMFD